MQHVPRLTTGAGLCDAAASCDQGLNRCSQCEPWCEHAASDSSAGNTRGGCVGATGTHPCVCFASVIDSRLPQPMARLPQTVPVSQMTSRVSSARGTIMQLPSVASSTVASDRLAAPSGRTKFAASCAIG